MNDRDLRAALQRDAGLVGAPPPDLLEQLVRRRTHLRRTRIAQAGAVAAVAVLAAGISVGASFLNRPDGSPATRTVPTPSVSRSAPEGPSAPSTTTPVPPTTTGSASDGTWQIYRNPRYGFSVEFPQGLAATSSVDGKGLTYRSSDGLTAATGAGSDTTAGVTATSEENRFASDLRHRGDLTYSHVDAASGTFTVSGHLEGGSIIVYVHGVVGPHTEYVLSWSYPTAEQETVQPWVVHSVETFRPGPL